MGLARHNIYKSILKQLFLKASLRYHRIWFMLNKAKSISGERRVFQIKLFSLIGCSVAIQPVTSIKVCVPPLGVLWLVQIRLAQNEEKFEKCTSLGGLERSTFPKFPHSVPPSGCLSVRVE